MLKPKQLDDLSQRLTDSLPKGLQTLQEDISRNLRATLDAGLAKLDLVTREEFEVQAAVLARTRAKLEALEAHVAELEGRLETGAPRKKAAAAAKPRTPQNTR
jgi:BMFP domain-containing protein YqiC